MASLKKILMTIQLIHAHGGESDFTPPLLLKFFSRPIRGINLFVTVDLFWASIWKVVFEFARVFCGTEDLFLVGPPPTIQKIFKRGRYYIGKYCSQPGMQQRPVLRARTNRTTKPVSKF